MRSISFFKSPETYTFNKATLSPFLIGACTGPLYSKTALIVFFFSLE